MTNPPATWEQVDDAQVRARAAIGAAAASTQPEPEVIDEPQAPVDGERPASEPRIDQARLRASRRLRTSSRFRRPDETPFQFTPPVRQQIRNNNVPLTVGLLVSIAAAFVVFIISLIGGTGGSDPIMPSFWRALGALAVLTTLSLCASWFMPAPSDRRQLLNRVESQEKLAEERFARRTMEVRSTGETVLEPIEDEPPGQEEPDKGGQLDVTLSDEDEGFDGAGATDFDFDDEEEEEDFFTASASRSAGPAGEQG